MRKHHWCEWNIIFFFYFFLCNTSSILSTNDSRLIKLVQCVNLIRRFPSYSISFYRRHFPHCASLSLYGCVCVCFITRTASLDLLKLARKERVRLNRFFLWHTRSVHSSRKEIVLTRANKWECNWYDTLKLLTRLLCTQVDAHFLFPSFSSSLLIRFLSTSLLWG